MKNITAGNLNKAIARIESAGFDPFTDLKLIQQENPRLVRPHGRKQSGRIMSYSESVSYQKGMQLKNPNIRVWTREQYENALQTFYNEHSAQFTVRGAKADFYQKAYDVLKAAGQEISMQDLKTLSVDEIRDIFEPANDVAKNKFGDSGKFYKTLKTSFEEYEKEHKRLDSEKLYEVTLDRFKELSTKKE